MIIGARDARFEERPSARYYRLYDVHIDAAQHDLRNISAAMRAARAIIASTAGASGTSAIGRRGARHESLMGA